MAVAAFQIEISTIGEDHLQTGPYNAPLFSERTACRDVQSFVDKTERFWQRSQPTFGPGAILPLELASSQLLSGFPLSTGFATYAFFEEIFTLHTIRYQHEGCQVER